MTIKQAILQSFKDINTPVNNMPLYDHIIKNGYFVFEGVTSPLITISYTLNRLYNNGKGILLRTKNPNGRGYLYFPNIDGAEEIITESVSETVVVKPTTKKLQPSSNSNPPFKTVKLAILQSFKDLSNIPSKNTPLYDHIIENDYFEFVGKTSPLQTISWTLNRLFDNGNGLLNRIDNPNGKGYLYFIKIENVVQSVVEEVQVEPIIEPIVEVEPIIEEVEVKVDGEIKTLEEKFEIATGLNFSTFYNKYRPKLVWYLTRYTRDQEIAEDFADDAFTQSLLKIDNYNSEKSQIHTWIYKIAENLVKKDFKDQKKMAVVSLDKENNENLNLINIIPNGQFEESNIMEQDSILIKKAEIVKDAINNLPDKYKKVMILRELENRPYIDIAEICTKELDFELNKEGRVLPNPVDFSELKINNKSNESSFIIITYNEGEEKTIELEVKPRETLKINKQDVENVSYLEVVSLGKSVVHYKTTTNLSTIKSQISKGRQLIQSMVHKRFEILEDQGLD